MSGLWGSMCWQYCGDRLAGRYPCIDPSSRHYHMHVQTNTILSIFTSKPLKLCPERRDESRVEEGKSLTIEEAPSAPREEEMEYYKILTCVLQPPLGTSRNARIPSHGHHTFHHIFVFVVAP